MRQLFHSLASGGCFVAAPLGETRAELAAVLAHFAVTSISASPWQLRRWLKSPAAPLPPLRSLQLIGDLITPEEVRAARAELSAQTYVVFGCNEVGRLTVLNPEDEPQPGGVGRLQPGVQARVDDGAGGSLPAGETGELAFRTPWMCQGYVDNPQATRERFRDGWFFSGDVGCINADGQVLLRGRGSDVINHGGLKIWPGDVEAVLRRHAQVRDAALVGVPDSMAGQVPVAFVVPRDPALLRETDRAGRPAGVWLGTQWGAHWGDDWGNQSGVPLSVPAAPGAALIEALHAFCVEHIDATRVPRRFVLVAEIPRNDAGKIAREALLAGLPLPS
jgi:acyl-coenzyme A synthetase/AMP-(fatty) acid ligase